MHACWSKTLALIIGAVLAALPASRVAAQATHSECLASGFCLCVSNDVQPIIQQKVQLFLDLVRSAHLQNKFAVYLSIPLSTGSGSYFALNREVANDTTEYLTERFGREHVWVLSPATPDADLPRGKATQSDYMYMWAQVLFGAEKSSNGFDLVYFSGPRDFARYLRLDGHDQLASLATYFHHRQETDPDFSKLIEQGKLTERDFESYYGLRARVSFSVGAHDEWNVVQKINASRRMSVGVINQLPIVFDGDPLPSSAYEETVMNGNVGACK